MTVLAVERAPAKINLCLFLGPTRADGRHELVTVFDSVALYDDLEVTPSAADEVVCEGVEGPNLVSDALAGLRTAGWDAPPVSVRITKRIPVAAGMGGGSADAAAMLRLAPRLAPVAAGSLAAIAAGLGADVPGQLAPGPSLGSGAGEIVKPLGALAPYAVLVLPQPFALSTPDVFRQADRLGLPRSSDELVALRAQLVASVLVPVRGAGPVPGAGVSLPGELLVNDLQDAAISLAPPIAAGLAAASDAGADTALVCGSGPTVIGLFDGSDGLSRAATAADGLRAAYPGAAAAAPLRAGAGGTTANE
jgi:4-diphosphocytidyl-2-C-methyl-D-erythritol kinase